MTKENCLTLTENTEFLDLIKINMSYSATQICGEAPGTMGAQQVIKRHNEAYKVLENPFTNVARYALVAAVQPGLYSLLTIEQDQSLACSSGTPDSAIAFTINSIWDDMSGVSDADKT